MGGVTNKTTSRITWVLDFNNIIIIIYYIIVLQKENHFLSTFIHTIKYKTMKYKARILSSLHTFKVTEVKFQINYEVGMLLFDLECSNLV
jgi:hypothetical protein